MNSIKDKLQDIDANIQYHLAKKGITSRTKPMDTSFKGRLIPAALGGLLTAAGSTVIPKYLLRMKINPTIALGSTAAGIGSGYFFPDVYNSVLQSERNEISKENAKNVIKSVESITSKLQNRTGDIVKHYQTLTKNASTIEDTYKFLKPIVNETSKEIFDYKKGLNKNASLIGTALSAGAKTVGTMGRLGFEGLRRVPKTAPLGTKFFGAVTKTVAGAGILAGGSKAYGAAVAPRSASNYNTFLRNNILAGNINPNELSQYDTSQVKRLGMR